jgi:hypothetical protein
MPPAWCGFPDCARRSRPGVGKGPVDHPRGREPREPAVTRAPSSTKHRRPSGRAGQNGVGDRVRRAGRAGGASMTAVPAPVRTARRPVPATPEITRPAPIAARGEAVRSPAVRNRGARPPQTGHVARSLPPPVSRSPAPAPRQAAPQKPAPPARGRRAVHRHLITFDLLQADLRSVLRTFSGDQRSELVIDLRAVRHGRRRYARCPWDQALK